MKKIIIVSVIVIILAVAAFFIWKMKKAEPIGSQAPLPGEPGFHPLGVSTFPTNVKQVMNVAPSGTPIINERGVGGINLGKKRN